MDTSDMILRDRGVTMSKGPKRQFTREYKEEALKLWEASGFKTNETAEKLGIGAAYLPRWQRQLQRGGRSHPASVGQLVAGSEAAELARLRRENAQLRMERDILKKATMIFGNGGRK
jgi:transposase